MYESAASSPKRLDMPGETTMSKQGSLPAILDNMQSQLNYLFSNMHDISACSASIKNFPSSPGEPANDQLTGAEPACISIEERMQRISHRMGDATILSATIRDHMRDIVG